MIETKTEYLCSLPCYCRNTMSVHDIPHCPVYCSFYLWCTRTSSFNRGCSRWFLTNHRKDDRFKPMNFTSCFSSILYTWRSRQTYFFISVGIPSDAWLFHCKGTNAILLNLWNTTSQQCCDDIWHFCSEFRHLYIDNIHKVYLVQGSCPYSLQPVYYFVLYIICWEVHIEP